MMKCDALPQNELCCLARIIEIIYWDCWLFNAAPNCQNNMRTPNNQQEITQSLMQGNQFLESVISFLIISENIFYNFR